MNFLFARTCPNCNYGAARPSRSRSSDRTSLFTLHAKYRCGKCGRSFQASSNAAYFLLAAAVVVAVGVVLGGVATGGDWLGSMGAKPNPILAYDTADVGKLLERAKKDDADAEYELHSVYLHGAGVRKDETEAIAWLQRAAEHGHVGAQYAFATSLREGRGVVQDYVRALQWMERAAAGGNLKAQYTLGLMYRDGIGAAPDFVKAYIQFNIAAARGYADAVPQRDAVIGKLTSEELLAAQAESRRIVEGRQK